MITDDGKNNMRGIDYVNAKARKCPQCKADVPFQKDTLPQEHSCGMKWRNVAVNGKIVGYDLIEGVKA